MKTAILAKVMKKGRHVRIRAWGEVTATGIRIRRVDKTRGGVAVARSAHNPQAAGSTPAPASRRMQLRTPERAIKASCLELLALYPSIRAWNQPAGVGRTMDGRRVIRYGVPGQADISGILDGGRRLEVEVKAEGGRLSEAQEAFRAMITGMGGLWLCVRSVQELADGLKAAGVTPARWRGRSEAWAVLAPPGYLDNPIVPRRAFLKLPTRRTRSQRRT